MPPCFRCHERSKSTMQGMAMLRSCTGHQTHLIYHWRHVKLWSSKTTPVFPSCSCVLYWLAARAVRRVHLHAKPLAVSNQDFFKSVQCSRLNAAQTASKHAGADRTRAFIVAIAPQAYLQHSTSHRTFKLPFRPPQNCGGGPVRMRLVQEPSCLRHSSPMHALPPPGGMGVTRLLH